MLKIKEIWSNYINCTDNYNNNCINFIYNFSYRVKKY